MEVTTRDEYQVWVFSDYLVKGCTSLVKSLYKSYSFFNIVQNAFDPSPPLPFENLVDFFSTDWEALCSALRLNNERHRSEETMSNIT